MSEQDIQKYEKMLEEDPQSRAFAPLAEAYRKTGNLEDAIRVAEAGLEIHPGYTGGLVVLGRALYEKKELDKAAEVLKKAVAETPESYLGQKFLGKVLVEKGENQAALSALEAANVQSPDDAEVIELIEKIRPKAQPPEAMVFSNAAPGIEAEEAGIVTYEQKPTTVDGVELEPLPLRVDEETFAFSEMKDEEFPTVEPSADAEVELESDLDTIEELGPEAAAFMHEADLIDDAVFTSPEEMIDQGEETFAIEDLMEEVTAVPLEVQPQPAAADDFDHVSGEEQVSPPVGEMPPPGQIPEAGPVDDPSPSASMEAEGFILSDESGEAEGIPPESPEDAMPAGTGPGDLEPPDLKPEQPVVGTPPGFVSVSQARPAPQAQPDHDRSASAGDISTETLADLYAKQGLVEKASEIYRQILLERPSDEDIAAKLRSLESRAEATMTNDAPAVIQSPEPDTSPADADDVLNILENWLLNAERMRQK